MISKTQRIKGVYLNYGIINHSLNKNSINVKYDTLKSILMNKKENKNEKEEKTSVLCCVL